MSALSEKIRKAREVRVADGPRTFIVLRPTDVDMMELRGASALRAILPFVVGWEGVTGLDLYPGGDGAPVAFEADACAEYLLDHIDVLAAITQAAIDAYGAHRQRLEEAGKN